MKLERGNLSRRGFIQRSLAGLAGTGLPVWFAKDVVAAAEIEQAQQQQQVQPSNTIIMGHIGSGDRGRAIAGEARRIEGVRYVANCDVDRGRRQSFAQWLGGDGITQFSDFRELVARPDINAVTIATVDHWHALAAMAAMRAGKDVYCEKPLTLTIAEGKALVKVARETNKILGFKASSAASATILLAAPSTRLLPPKVSIGISGWAPRPTWTTSRRSAITPSGGFTNTPAAR
jgi:hypothetical protein